MVFVSQDTISYTLHILMFVVMAKNDNRKEGKL